MDPFFTSSRQWSPGMRVLHLYVLPRLSRDTALADLVSRAGEVLAGHPGVDRPIPEEWLHLTVQAIGMGGAPLSEPTQRELIARLTDDLATVPACVLSVGPPMIGGSGVLADVHPDDPFTALVRRAQATIAAVCGPTAVTGDARPPHLALAYARTACDSGPLAGALRHQVRPSHAPLTVEAVHLVKVEQDPDNALFSWTQVHEFPLRKEVMA